MNRQVAPPRAARVRCATEIICLVDAVALLANLDRREYDTDRVRLGRMRRRIQRAVASNELSEMVSNGEKYYELGRLAAWAQSKWPLLYDDLPSIRDEIRGSMVATGPRATLVSSGHTAPTTLHDCLRALEEALQRVFSLEKQVKLGLDEAEKLRPDAESWKRHCTQNRERARQKRPRGKQSM